ncbi:MAG: GTP cyclohydrolase I, partial [Planctomycetes bacterium]|nr:GTP cyclohydrolase I [Planctomycetota bacterium]
QIQERLTTQIADTIDGALSPEGVGVVLSAEHMCMSLRGVKKLGSKIVTKASRGSMRNDEATRREFDSMLREG